MSRGSREERPRQDEEVEGKRRAIENKKSVRKGGRGKFNKSALRLEGY